MGLLRGEKPTVIYFQKTKEEKVKNLHQRESGTPTLHSGPLVLNSQLFSPHPPAQEIREIKEKETPFPIPNQLTK